MVDRTLSYTQPSKQKETNVNYVKEFDYVAMGTWNLLADGLALNEFACPGGLFAFFLASALACISVCCKLILCFDC